MSFLRKPIGRKAILIFLAGMSYGILNTLIFLNFPLCSNKQVLTSTIKCCKCCCCDKPCKCEGECCSHDPYVPSPASSFEPMPATVEGKKR